MKPTDFMPTENPRMRQVVFKSCAQWLPAISLFRRHVPASVCLLLIAMIYISGPVFGQQARPDTTKGVKNAGGVVPVTGPSVSGKPRPFDFSTGAREQAPVVSSRHEVVNALRGLLMQWRGRFQYILPTAGIIFVLIYAGIARRRAPFLRGMLAVPLLILAVLSVWHYAGFYPWLTKTYFNHYEFYHYYIGAKYAPEVGYAGMYDASLVADAETGQTYTSKTIRNLGYMRGSVEERNARGDRPYYDLKYVLDRKAEIKADFSPERWKEFVKDIGYFKRSLGAGRWSKIMLDKGYNATPVWGATGGILSGLVSTDNKAGLQAIALLDPLLILLSLACVAWAYGPRAACFVGAFFGANYLTMLSPTMKMAFLRTDWITLTVMGACFVKKGWYGTAGGLMAYAGLARLFPVIFAFGMGARGLIVLFHTRRFPWPHFRFFLAYGVVAALLVGVSIMYAGGLHQWHEFFEKIGYHNDDISTWRVGFKYLFLGTFDQPPPGVGWWNYKAQLQTFLHDYAMVWWGIQGFVLLLTLLAVRHLRDDESIPFSFVPVFFMVAPTHYYHMMLVIPVLFLATKVDAPLRAAGLIYLFGMCMVGWRYNSRGWQFPLAFDMSCLLLAFVLYLLLVPGIERRLETCENGPPTPAQPASAATPV